MNSGSPNSGLPPVPPPDQGTDGEALRPCARADRDRAKRPSSTAPLPPVGWREWVALPNLGVAAIKAKIDTGARTSALHAFDVQYLDRDDRPWVQFCLHPLQRSNAETAIVSAPVLEFRTIRSSTGHEQHRPVIRTPIRLGTFVWDAELTLTNRDAMGFRMLLGRQALRHRFWIDPSRSFLQGKRPRSLTSAP